MERFRKPPPARGSASEVSPLAPESNRNGLKALPGAPRHHLSDAWTSVVAHPAGELHLQPRPLLDAQRTPIVGSAHGLQRALENIAGKRLSRHHARIGIGSIELIAPPRLTIHRALGDPLPADGGAAILHLI